jgi:D-beta-D-heptose 7-phosphate kinase/D-beta-D-heptose 1-phosphate adenosyltransferase
MKTIVITSGYFNPIHPWHIECFELCKSLGDELRVIVNNDYQTQLKTWSREIFQDQEYRIKVVSAMKMVDRIVLAVDTDWSVCESIRTITNKIRSEYGDDTQIIFGKGGDRFADNIPEVKVCQDLYISIRDGLWAKIDNSSVYRAKRI